MYFVMLGVKIQKMISRLFTYRLKLYQFQFIDSSLSIKVYLFKFVAAKEDKTNLISSTIRLFNDRPINQMIIPHHNKQ